MHDIRCPICRAITIKDEILFVANTAETTLGSKFVEMIKQIKESEKDFIIFTQFKKLIQNIKYALDKYSIPNITFTELLESKFTKSTQIIIMSSEENASGIDELKTFSNMIIFEPFLDYSYGKQIEKQLVGRIRRIGQKKDTVNVYRYYVNGTIEEKIYL
jgi:SNF2 family DNA or RNA helicase